jgi:hypothetical protein
MELVAPLIATALALAAPSTQTSERAVALLSDNRLIELALPSGKIVVRRRLGPKPRERITAGRFLAPTRERLFVLVSTGTGSDSIAVLDARTAKLLTTYALEPGVRYRGIVLAGELIYAYGGRLGDEVDKTNHLREESAVLTHLDVRDGARRVTVTVRPADGHMWWIYWGAARDDASSVVLSYHGGCYPDATELCTSGADWVDADGVTLRSCQMPASRSGCLAETHGMIEPYGVGWIATTGSESLVQYGQHGNVLRRLHTGLRRDHVMNFAFNVDRSRLYVLSSCLYGRDGLRRVSLSGGPSRLVRAKICGESLAVARMAFVVRRANAIDVRRPKTATLRSTQQFRPDVLDVVATG